ncbi:conserved transmembrane ATP-binding ABC transporter domain protein [Mycobacterium kansasii]|uniref:Conserved transmembrane ATP-binding ABC transporter domain protein n=1 Tax=Mycobacterium kansasii TaxID=1768 RepID=A0A1V3X1K1_MYCKA|nr:conserved transmembrane ATP-binding ABC transporter domain protein [Mycobacterium kansasii]
MWCCGSRAPIGLPWTAAATAFSSTAPGCRQSTSATARRSRSVTRDGDPAYLPARRTRGSADGIGRSAAGASADPAAYRSVAQPVKPTEQATQRMPAKLITHPEPAQEVAQRIVAESATQRIPAARRSAGLPSPSD